MGAPTVQIKDSVGVEVLGKVTDSPVANTVLARLKALLTDGAYTTPTHTAVNVTIASGAVLAANANRIYALLTNISDTTIWFKLGAAAVVNQGFPITSYGKYEMSKKEGNLYTGAINGIHAGAGNKVCLVSEGV